MPRYTIPRVAHCSRDCDGGALPVTTVQAWILVTEAGVIAVACLFALAFLSGLLRGRPPG